MIFNISKIILLASLNVISICASTGIEPDFKINVKVPADLPDPRMDFNTAFKNITNEEQLNHFEKNKKNLLKLCEDTKQSLADVYLTIDKIATETNLDSSVKEAALDIVEAEHEEWEIREKIINQIVISHDSFLNLNYRFIENLKLSAMKWFNLPDFKNCTKDLELCFTNRYEYKTMRKDIKTSLLAYQMIEELNEVPAEFIRPDWKPLLHHLNVPKERFMIASIKPDMNLHYLMNTKEKDLENSIKILNIEMARLSFISSKQPENVKNMLRLRKQTLKIVLAKPMTLESINLRVKAFERLAESVVRSNQLNQPFDDHLSTILIKMWLLSRQMFTENGWNENMYGFIESKTTQLESSLSGDKK